MVAAPGSGLAVTMHAPDAQAAAVRLEEVGTRAGLERLGSEWERLWALAPDATPFQSPHWLLPWWKHIGRGTLATLAVRSARSDELVGLAPLYVHRDPATGRRHLFPIGIATTDQLNALSKPGWEARVIRCLAGHLARRGTAWDVLEIPQLRRGAPLLGLAAAADWRHEIIAGDPHPVLALPGSPSDAALPIPRSMADNLRYCRRRAARERGFSYHTADAQTWPMFLDALARLHASRWAERGLPGVLDGEGVLAAHREAVPLLQSAGLLRLHGLCHAGELIAVLYCLFDPEPAHERRCSYYLGGFDPRYRALSPGTLLVAHAIEQAMAEGATAFDFLRGAEAYKYRWGARDEPMCTLRVWANASAPLAEAALQG
jgi:CelD/BcsL family acetyltransferase involved in cellulose biosynthesis